MNITELTKENLTKVIQFETVEEVSVSTLNELFRHEKGLADFAPDGVCRTDPRDGSMVVFNPRRAKRPHDNRIETAPSAPPSKPCPICGGNTTGVVDVAELSEGFTFINKNLFPCVYPFGGSSQAAALTSSSPTPDTSATGLHFLQWTSTKHDQDWHNMKAADLMIVLSRLGVLEKCLLNDKSSMMPETDEWHDGRPVKGFVSIIKNVGAQVGGSLAHGHQQIIYSNTMPSQTYNNWRFFKRRGLRFSDYIRQTSPDTLVIKDLGEAVVLVPYFMKRPYWAMVVLKNAQKQFVYDLNEAERLAIADGWSKLAVAYSDMLPGMGREVAYNVLLHTGPGAGLYLEFLPYTQETGGYEQLGLWVCQADPESAASTLRGYF